jgi:hypothetical protein
MTVSGWPDNAKKGRHGNCPGCVYSETCRNVLRFSVTEIGLPRHQFFEYFLKILKWSSILYIAKARHFRLQNPFIQLSKIWPHWIFGIASCYTFQILLFLPRFYRSWKIWEHSGLDPTNILGRRVTATSIFINENVSFGLPLKKRFSPSVVTRVTRLGDFSPVGWLFSLGRF